MGPQFRGVAVLYSKFSFMLSSMCSTSNEYRRKATYQSYKRNVSQALNTLKSTLKTATFGVFTSSRAVYKRIIILALFNFVIFIQKVPFYLKNYILAYLSKIRTKIFNNIKKTSLGLRKNEIQKLDFHLNDISHYMKLCFL